MLNPKKVCVTDLNSHLLCALCGGYFIDATTIIECLHSFCKTCIVRFLETSKYCPTCDVQVHKTKPLQNIRPDGTLQDIVYKLVPGLFQKEMQLRRKFYSEHPESAAKGKEDGGEPTETYNFYCAEDQFNLELQYANPTTEKPHESQCEKLKRFLRCPAAVTVAHIQKLIRAKHDLTQEHRIDIWYPEAVETLREDFSLMDVAYIYNWKMRGPMHLMYQIYEVPCKKRKLDVDQPSATEVLVKDEMDITEAVETSVKPKSPNPIVPSPVKNKEAEGETWKEVQLQISETGIMKVVTPHSLSKETIISSGKVDSQTSVKEIERNCLKPEKSSRDQVTNTKDTTNNKMDMSVKVSQVASTSATTKTTTTTISSVSVPMLPTSSASSAASSASGSSTISLKRGDPIDVQKELEKKNSVVASSSHKAERIEPHKSSPSVDSKKDGVPSVVKSSPTPIVRKPAGYKTLKLPPKSWNPSVSRGSYATLNCSVSKAPVPIFPKVDSEAPETSKSTNVPVVNKQPRFFKERDRPRFLGNPVSGVKPMYQIQSDIPSRPNPQPLQSPPSMIKIDPKTLSPMTSKSHSTPPHSNCSTATSSASVTITTVANAKPMSKMLPSVPHISPVLHPPPNPLLYSFQGLMNSPLIKPPIIPHSAPHHFPQYLPQPMFYTTAHNRFQPSLPAVQRIPANVHSPKSPTPIPVSTHIPTATVTTASKVEVAKVNGDVSEKSSKKEDVDVNGQSLVEKVNNDKSKNESSNNINNNNNNVNSNESSKVVKSVDNNNDNPEPSKPVPPASPAQK